MHAGISLEISYVPGGNKFSVPVLTGADSWKPFTWSLSFIFLFPLILNVKLCWHKFVNKFAQVAPQEFPLFSWWCIFLECFCNIGWCLLCGWCVCPSKESWTQIRFGSRKHHSSWHLKGHLQVWSSVSNDTVYQLFDWPHAGVGLYSSSHTNYIQAWKRKIDSAYAWYSTKQGGWVVRALKSWNPEVAGSSPLWPLSWSCFSVYW